VAKVDLGSAVPRQADGRGASNPTRGPGPRRARRRPPPWETRYVRRLVAVDLVVGVGAGALGAGLELDRVTGAPASVQIAALPLALVAALAANRTYERRYLFVGTAEYARVVRAWLGLTAIATIGSYAAGALPPRGYVLAAFPLAAAACLLARLGLRRGLHRARAGGGCMRRVLLVGHAGPVVTMTNHLRRTRYHGLDVVAACVPEGEAADVPVLGDFTGISGAVRAAAADVVLVLPSPELDGHALRRLAWQVEGDGVELIVASSLVDVAGARTTIRPVDGLSLMHVAHPVLDGWRRLVKAVFDRTAALVLIILAMPVLTVIGLSVLVTSGAPILFRQIRVGKDGRSFTMIKFRTMYRDAPDRLANLRASNDSDGVLFKLRDDPRVTRVGWWLRRFSLDELPQLGNVLAGQMSLVGPRPPLPDEVASYPADLRRRLAVKPGMTGLWQVSGRSDLPWEEAVRLDLKYVENWTLTLDLVILLRTLVAVIRPSGAY
jgi:exopolysaccharide biosynthesis polyprenyl glycosylphosphotransferase